MNRCSKFSRCVYEIPHAFIGRISQAEPKKLASVVNPKRRRALGIARSLYTKRGQFSNS